LWQIRFVPEGIFLEVLAFVLGLIVGSFLNVCIVRLPKEESLVRPASHCPYCKTPIRWYDNIPVISWLILRGRCRNPGCKQGISLLYPSVELLTGLLFWAIAGTFGLTLEAGKWALLLCLLIVHAVTDLRERFLSFRLNQFGIAAGLVSGVAVPAQTGVALWIAEMLPAVPPREAIPLLGLAEGVLGAVLGAGILWSVSRAYLRFAGRPGMGDGDIWLMAMVGAFLGVKLTFFTILLGSLLGSVVGVIWIGIQFARGWKRPVAERAHRRGLGSVTALRFALARRYQLPFGTYLSAAAAILVLKGAAIWQAVYSLTGGME
jgi:leader peptidase (prepilin peptidase)/N-methyltransferase